MMETAAWQAWSTTQNHLRQLRQPAPPLVFPGKPEIFRAMYAQVGEEEQVISPPYTRFFFFVCSLLLRCDLLAKKVPGRAPYSQHIMIRIWT